MSLLLDIRPEKIRVKKFAFLRTCRAADYDRASGDVQSYSGENKSAGDYDEELAEAINAMN
jgi:hypothetical protein